jgi:hypothetical protein
MSINSDSGDRVTQQALTNVKTAAATDRHNSQLRLETDLQANNEQKFAWESNIRETANMEIGRARNLVRVV